MSSLAQVSDVRTSQSDVKTHALARLWTNLADAELLGYLTSATERVEGIVGQRLAPFTTTETVRFTRTIGNVGYPVMGTPVWYASAGIRPPRYPELWTGTVTGISALDPISNATVAVPLTGIQFDATSGRVLLPYLGLWGDTSALLSYGGGYSTVPKSLITATVHFAGYDWLVETDSRNGQADAGDLYTSAMNALTGWVDQVAPGIA